MIGKHVHNVFSNETDGHIDGIMVQLKSLETFVLKRSMPYDYSSKSSVTFNKYTQFGSTLLLESQVTDPIN